MPPHEREAALFVHHTKNTGFARCEQYDRIICGYATCIFEACLKQIIFIRFELLCRQFLYDEGDITAPQERSTPQTVCLLQTVFCMVILTAA